MPKPPNSQNGKGPKRAVSSKEPRHGNMSGAISINTYPFYILHFTFFTTTPPSLSNAPQPGPPLARSPPQTASTYLSVRYRNHCLRKHGRRRLIYHILRFIDNQRSIGLSLKIHGILTFAENTGVCERSSKRCPKSWMWGAKQYLLLMLFITADYYLFLITITLTYVLIHHDGIWQHTQRPDWYL